MSKASGDTKITIEQIAQDLGCSKTTVSRALSGKGRVGKEMQKKILAYCKRIGYKKKETDVSDETFKTNNIGVFLPAALPRIFSGIKVGWARAWRGLISAEMIFGGGGALGIGYFIQDRRTNTDIAGVFAAIIVIVIIGMVVEYGIFRNIENKTFRKWGMTR